MTQLPNQDLLSAFLDGELSAREREEMERLLATSAEAQQELEDFKALSGLLQDLPGERVPPEFRSRVLQAAERGMLLDEPVSSVAANEDTAGQLHSTASTPAVARQSQASKRGLWWPAAAIVAAAAGLLVMVRLLQESGDQATHLAEVPVGAKQTVENEPGYELAANDASTGASFESAPSESITPMTAAGDDSAPADQPRPSAAAPALAELSELRDQGEEPEGTLAGLPHLVFDKDLSEARVGEVLKGFDKSGDEVVVCRVTVVDMQAGLDSLQLLLMRNNVQPESDLYRADQDEAKETQSGPEAGRMFAIYVEATHNELALALAALKDEAPFQDQQMHVEQTLNVAMLDETVVDLQRFRKGAANELSRGRLAPPLEAAPEPEADSPASSTADAADEESAKDDARTLKKLQRAAPKSAEMPIADNRRFLAPGMSRQYKTEVPAGLLGGRAEPSAKAGRSLAQQRAAEPGGERLRENRASRATEAAAPMQVLFVLVPAESDAQGSPLKKARSRRDQPSSEDSSPQGASAIDSVARAQRQA